MDFTTIFANHYTPLRSLRANTVLLGKFLIQFYKLPSTWHNLFSGIFISTAMKLLLCWACQLINSCKKNKLDETWLEYISLYLEKVLTRSSIKRWSKCILDYISLSPWAIFISPAGGFLWRQVGCNWKNFPSAYTFNMPNIISRGK